MTKPITTLYPASREHPARVEGEIAHAHVRIGPNATGRVCGICGATTYGLSDACGKCGSRVR